MADEQVQRLDEARGLLDGGEPDAASAIALSLTGHSDPDVAGEAWLIIGTARYRADDEAGALAAWRSAANAGGRSARLGRRSAGGEPRRAGGPRGGSPPPP